MNKADRIILFKLSYLRFFPDNSHLYVKSLLEKLDGDQLSVVEFVKFRDPHMVFLVSFIAGYLGADRFLIGNIGLGVLKLITLGGLSVWALIDLCFITRATKRYNLRTLERVISQFNESSKLKTTVDNHPSI